MKHSLNFYAKAFLISIALVGSLSMTNAAMAAAPVTAPIDLAKAPLATSSSTVVKPNLLFVLDNSGSMDWDHMPDDAGDGGSNVSFNFGYYGLRSSQCNQVYYDPNTTYQAPIKADNTSYPDAIFTSAAGGLQGGYAASPTAVDLNSNFRASQSLNQDAAPGGSAYYYEYTGVQTTQLQKNYNNTANTFYSECNSSQNTAPGNNVFSKRRLATTITTPIIVNSSTVVAPTSSFTVASSVSGAPTATITVAGTSVSTSVANIKVNGTTITSGASSASTNSNTVASNIAAKINGLTATTGYAATAVSGVINITGPAVAAGFIPAVTKATGSGGTFTTTTFTAAKTVSSIKVNGVELLSAAATTDANATITAANIAAQINTNTATSGFSATTTGKKVDITGPASATGFTPVIIFTAGAVTISPSPTAFTSGTAVSSILVNSIQLLSGPATADASTSITASNIKDKINAISGTTGFSATTSGNVITVTGPLSAANYTPVIASVAGLTFTTDVFPDNTAEKLTNFANWYSFYRTRMLMMKTAAGLAFSELVGSDYRVGLMKISASTSPTVPVGLFTGAQRTNWYSQLYSTSTSGSTPLRTALSNAGKYYAKKLGGTDPIQYSCQQNFSIMSTDGYWNAGDGSDLNGAAVGNQDGVEARPQNDGFTPAGTTTTLYKQYVYTILSGQQAFLAGCTASQQLLQYQVQNQTCTALAGVTSCGPWTNNGAPSTVGNSCQNTVAMPNPNPSLTTTVGSPSTGGGAGTSDNLADVAMYYYKTDLRPDLIDNVFSTTKDELKTQHMTTFTLGLGASGYMNYSSSYIGTPNEGDFGAVNQLTTANASVCTWQAAGTICTWPVPGMSGSDGLLSNIDDLWHAAVNGHGAYFSATDPASLSSGLSNALAAINARKGSSAAAATSTLNPVAGNNLAYVASYNTVEWTGNLEARGINTATGEVNQNALWCVENVLAGSCNLKTSSVTTETVGNTQTTYCVTPNASGGCNGGVWQGTSCKIPVATACEGKMAKQAAGITTPRKIWTKSPNGATPASLDNFHISGGVLNAADFSATRLNGTAVWADGAAAALLYKDDRRLNQWPSLSTTQRGNADGEDLVNYLRGQKDHEISTNNPDDNQVFRYREAIMGDAIESQPAFIGKPTFSYTDSGYSAFVSSNTSRAPTVYMGANDGMMHAFDASADVTAGGTERWAYVPSMLIPKMFALASDSYASNHAYYANGSPIISDIFDGTWKTILVAGLNGGGRGYYAVDITDPVNPKQMWEFSNVVDSNNAAYPHDDNLGYTFGNPVITKRADGKWVVLVTSGYNNIPDASPLVKYPLVSTGDGKGYLYVLDAATGQILSTLPTGVGSTATPSGLAQIASWADDPEKNNTTTFTYGGDLLGNVWRFDISRGPSTGSNPNPSLFATLKANGVTQPITTRPELGKVLTSDGKTHRVVFIGTGKYLESTDLIDTQQQTLYAIKDDDTLTSTTPTPTLNDPRSSTGAGANHMVQQVITSGTSSRTATNNDVDFLTDRGWFVDFKDPGERQNVASQLVLGSLLVPTTVPSNTVCEPGGTSWLNYFNYKKGGPVNSGTNTVVSTKMTAPIVGINVMYIPGSDGKLKPVVSTVTADDPTPALVDGVEFSPSGSGFQKKRVIWRELTQ